jgi:hypothetical protein
LSGIETLALKLVVTPVLVGVASLAGRKWGSEIGGWLVGIPFTSGPIAFFLALDAGRHFAAAHRLEGGASAVGVLRGLTLGLFSFAGFFLAVALLLEPDGIVVAFASAIAVALLMQLLTLTLGRRLRTA